MILWILTRRRGVTEKGCGHQRHSRGRGNPDQDPSAGTYALDSRFRGKDVAGGLFVLYLHKLMYFNILRAEKM